MVPEHSAESTLASQDNLTERVGSNERPLSQSGEVVNGMRSQE
jgi:hypothetical protein